MFAVAAVFAAVLIPCAARAEGESLTPENGIPLVIVRVAEQEMEEEEGDWYGSIEDMNGSKDHSVRCHGTVEIIVPEGYAPEYGGTVPAGEVELKYIRGRGNTTWGMQKKPYKIKLSSPADLFSMGSADEWGLIANSMDPTMLKNRISYWLGQQLGREETPQLIPCDLVMIGSREPDKPIHLGSYYLSELISLGEGRLNIEKPKKSTISLDGEPNITGGYLISYYTEGQNGDEPASTVFKTNAGIELMNKEPDYDDTGSPLTEGQEAQRTYIRNYIQEIEGLIVNSPEITQEIHDQIAAKMDLESLADYWLLQEFARNGDAFATSSTYLYKKRNGPLCWGPLWDLDIGYGEFPIDDIENNEGTTGFNNTEMLWVDQLRQKDPEFVKILRGRWEILDKKLEELTADGGVIDDYKAEIEESKKKDEEIWKDAYEEPDEGPQDESGEGASDLTYDQYVENLKDWIESRRFWFNKNFDNIGTAYATVTFTADGQVIGTTAVRCESYADESEWPEPTVKKGYVFKGWYQEGSEKTINETRIDKDMVFVARYIPEEEAVAPKALYFSSYDIWEPIGKDTVYCPTTTIIPEDATDQRIKWTVSDESVAEVGAGFITPKSVGTTVITGTMYNGVSNSATLHIYDPGQTTPVDPTGITPAQTQLVLKKGEIAQIRYTVQPEGVPLTEDLALFEEDDPSIVEVGPSSGVIRALKAGKTTVTLTIHYGEDEEDTDGKAITTTCTVTVIEDPETCTITYDLSGGTLNGKTGKITQQCKTGDVITMPDAPVKKGYSFAYWKGSRLYPGDKYTVKGDHSFKAIWTKKAAKASGRGSAKTGSSAASHKKVRTVRGVRTGDDHHTVIWTVCLIISGAAVLAAVRRRRRYYE